MIILNNKTKENEDEKKLQFFIKNASPIYITMTKIILTLPCVVIYFSDYPRTSRSFVYTRFNPQFNLLKLIPIKIVLVIVAVERILVSAIIENRLSLNKAVRNNKPLTTRNFLCVVDSSV